MAAKVPTAEEQKAAAKSALMSAEKSLETLLSELPSDEGREVEEVKRARGTLAQSLSHVQSELRTYAG